MEKKGDALIVAGGLGDHAEFQNRLLDKATKLWGIYGFEKPELFVVDWRDKETSSEEKMERLENTVDRLSVKDNLRVSLIGLSAGGPMVLDAYIRSLREGENSNINRILTLCSRLREGDLDYWTEEKHQYDKTVPAYHEFVKRAESGVDLTDERGQQVVSKLDRQRIKNAIAWFGDRHTPTKKLGTVEGAHFKRLRTPGHTFTIAAGLTFPPFSIKFAKFLRLREK